MKTALLVIFWRVVAVLFTNHGPVTQGEEDWIWWATK
jgi:hypothetical protein